MPSGKIGFDYSLPWIMRIKLGGEWGISAGLPAVSDITAQLAVHPEIKQITFDVTQVRKWDSGFVSFLLHLVRECEDKGVRINRDGLPEGAQKLLELALRPAKEAVARQTTAEPFLARIGTEALKIKEVIRTLLDFLGEVAVAFGRLARGKVYFRGDDFALILEKCGSDAFALVSLISILVGIIFAFIGAIQLQLFGAQVFIADIVGIATVRVMGAVMTGVLMAGRTGSAFAAELGLMQTNEEIDALKTLGVSPVEFLVLPRVLALLIMMPLLTIYADLMGILGGFIVSVGILDINPVEYLNHTREAVKLSNFWIGLIHSMVFAIIISIAGCLRGIKCERNAASVGEATTAAVVNAIAGIVIATAVITFICQMLGV